MTTKNYAAQVMKSLKETHGYVDLSVEEDVANLESMKIMLEGAVHFTLPDDGVILGSGLKGIKGEEVRLPYPVITLEYIHYFRNAIVKTLVLASEFSIESEEEQINIGCVVFYKIGNESKWAPCPISFEIPSSWDSKMEGTLIVAESHLALKSVFAKLEKKLKRLEEQGYYAGQEQLDSYERVCRQFSGCVHSVLELCEALSCTNIEQKVDQEESKANPKRIRKGKLPILETRTLVINATGTKGEREGYQIQGERNSPRQHLRRGHFRFLRPLEGEDKRRKTWVRSCVVGSTGKIDKEYEVK